MILQKAIEILEELQHHPIHKGNSCHKSAVKMGAAALKRIKIRRERYIYSEETLLPGEHIEKERK